MTPDSLILLGVGGYLLANLAVGLAASRRIHDHADYIVAGRRLPLGLCTATLFATWFGGGTALGASGAAYQEGLLGVIADPFGAALCLLLFGTFYVSLLRRLGVLTVVDFFRDRFGATAELAAAACLLPAYVGWVGSQFVAFGLILNAIAGVDTTLGIVIGAALVIAYTVAGGLWAVTRTDAIQALVLIVGLAVLAGAVLAGDDGAALLARVPREQWRFAPEADLRSWLFYLQAWLVIGLGAIPSQDLVQRGLAARDEPTARRSAWLAGLLYLGVGFVPVLLGILGRVLLPELENPELVLPQLCLAHLPPLGVALVLGALLSAIMSSADSALLAPASVLSQNVARHLRPGLSDVQLLRVARASVPLFGVLSLGIGLWFENVYDLMVSSWSVLLVSLVVPLTAGLYSRRVDGPAALASMGAGLGAWLVLAAVQDAWPADLLALGVSAATLTATARLRGRTAAA